jgi:predicted ATPase
VLRDCVVLAVEGTYGSGKTTLARALATHYSERGIKTSAVEEPWRCGSIIEDIAAHGATGLDVEAVTGLFAAQLSAQLQAAREHRVIVCDTTVANVLARAWLALETPPRSRAAATLAAMEAFCRAWASAYDAVFYCCDWFSRPDADGLIWAVMPGTQPAADRVIRSTCATVGQKVIDIPPSMTTARRVDWITAQVTRLGIITR